MGRQRTHWSNGLLHPRMCSIGKILEQEQLWPTCQDSYFSWKTQSIWNHVIHRYAQEHGQNHHNGLLQMKLHRDYFKRQLAMPNIAMNLSNLWINNAYLCYKTESLICAAQEQALATKYVSTKIWHTGNNTKCRLCGKNSETVHHIVSGCKMLSAK